MRGGKSGEVSVKSTTFIGNKGKGPGGAIHLYQTVGNTDVVIEDCTFLRNQVSKLKAMKYSTEILWGT